MSSLWWMNDAAPGAVERMVRTSLRKRDPMKLAGESPPGDRYDAVVPVIAERLLRANRKPTPDEAAFIAFGSLKDTYGRPSVYAPEFYRAVGESISKGWDDCRLLIG